MAESLYNLVQSGAFSNALLFLTYLALAGAIVMIALLIHQALQPRLGRPDRDDDPWLVAMATLMDMFILNALYVTLDFLRAASSFTGPAGAQNTPRQFAFIVMPFIELAIYAAAAVVVVRRLGILRRWFERRRGQ